MHAKRESKVYFRIVTSLPWVYVYYEDGIDGTQGVVKGCPVELIATRNESKRRTLSWGSVGCMG